MTAHPDGAPAPDPTATGLPDGSPDGLSVGPVADLSAGDAAEIAGELAVSHQRLAAAAAVAAEGIARADTLAQTLPQTLPQTPPQRLPRTPAPAVPAGQRGAPSGYPRWGWRRALRFGLQRRMYTPDYLRLYARYLVQRLRRSDVELQGMVFLGRRVELHARRHHGRLVVGAWSWIGDDNKLRSHEGSVRLGAKVVLGRDNVVNSYLDVEIGANSLLGDWIYICDFDHRHDRVDVPIRKQGLAKTPVRIGEDVWIGEKASILRGADIGSGSVIASQALVRGHIPPFSVVVGSPARVIRSRLPKGMTAAEALDLQRRGAAIPGDPIGG